MADPTLGGLTAPQMMETVVQKAYAEAIALATLAGLSVPRGERAALKAGCSAGAMAMFSHLNGLHRVLLDAAPECQPGCRTTAPGRWHLDDCTRRGPR